MCCEWHILKEDMHLLEDMSHRNTGFTGGLLHRRACIAGGHVLQENIFLLEGILHNSIYCRETKVSWKNKFLL